jgi:uncharacterized damage-inducible protein DinB
MTELAAYLRIQAHANRLMNHRLHAAMAPLSRAELHAPRTSFFPSLMATLNHILAVDLYYVAVLDAGADPQRAWHGFEAADDIAALAPRQAAVDQRLIDWCDRCVAQGAAIGEHRVAMPRAGGRVQHDRAAHMLAHLFMHQVHHRGQVHAMLSGTRVAPPQLDEFMMPSEAHLRTPEMAALGWREGDVYAMPAPRMT